MTLRRMIYIGIAIGSVSFLLSSVALLSLLSWKVREQRSKEPQPLGWGMGALIIFVTIAVTGIAIGALLFRNSVKTTDVDRLINMQGITLAITGAAVSIISIISALQNYDREKKSKELQDKVEKSIQDSKASINNSLKIIKERQKALDTSVHEGLKHNVEQINTFGKAIEDQNKENKKLNDDLRENIRVLFDSNSEDDVHLRIRIANYRRTLEKNPRNLNVGLALIDALARRSSSESDQEQKIDNDTIIKIVDEFLQSDLESLEWINLQIKKGNACYENGKLSALSGDNRKAKEYMEQAQNIFRELLNSDNVPKELTGYLAGYLGLCYFWQYTASGKTDVKSLDESIRLYDKCIVDNPKDAKILNSRAVSYQNKARMKKDKSAKIDALLQVREEYEKAIVADPTREKAWLNIASVEADVLHLMLGIDPRDGNYDSYVEISWDDKLQAKGLYDDGIDHLEKAMIINPGFVNLYYVHADLSCCMALISNESYILPDAKRRLEYARLLDPSNRVVTQIIQLYNWTASKLVYGELII